MLIFPVGCYAKFRFLVCARRLSEVGKCEARISQVDRLSVICLLIHSYNIYQEQYSFDFLTELLTNMTPNTVFNTKIILDSRVV